MITMKAKLKETLIAFFQYCDTLKGNQITIQEYISTNKNNFDRHFTTSSKLVFEMTNFGVRMSGARAMFMGEKQSYEIGVDRIIHFEQLKENEYELIEKYSETAHRKSILLFEILN